MTVREDRARSGWTSELINCVTLGKNRDVVVSSIEPCAACGAEVDHIDLFMLSAPLGPLHVFDTSYMVSRPDTMMTGECQPCGHDVGGPIGQALLWVNRQPDDTFSVTWESAPVASVDG